MTVTLNMAYVFFVASKQLGDELREPLQREERPYQRQELPLRFLEHGLMLFRLLVTKEFRTVLREFLTV